MAKTTPKQLKKRYQDLKARRGTWENHWQEIADYMLPNKNNITVKRSPGQKRNTQIFDNTAMYSLQQFAGALSSMLTNPQSQWFELFTGNPEVDDQDAVRFWLQDTQRRIMDIINGSNFNSEIHEAYIDVLAFGTAGLFIEEDDELVVRFMAKGIDSIVIAENNRGFVDEVYRSFKWNARNIVQEFGEKVLENDKLRKSFEEQDETEYEIIHGLYPNKDKESGPLSQFEFISQYCLECDDFELDVGGYLEWPFPVVRNFKATGEIYGRSQGMTALPDTKSLNLMMEQTIKAAAKTMDPPLSLPDDGYLLPLKTSPGSFNFYRAGTEPVVPLLGAHVNLNPQFNFEVINRIAGNIRNAFYLDVLHLVENDRMTATEVNARQMEQIRVLGPLVGRKQDELLSPTIFRVFSIMERRGLIERAPEAIVRAGGLQVRYSGPLAKAQRLSQTGDILRTVELAAPFINADPSVIDNIDGDAALREIVRLQNFPAKAIRTKQQVQAIRESRAQQAAQQNQLAQQSLQAEQASQLAPVIKAVSG